MSGSEPHIPFLSAGSYPLRAGNRVRPFVDGEAAFRRICEAVEAAQHSVWITVAFFAEFQMPGGRGSSLDVLDRAAARGLDVRLIVWRPNPETGIVGNTFPGSAENHEMLRTRGSRFRVRWDRALGRYCQHQKSWVIDAGDPAEIAFVGGMNLTSKGMGARGHAGGIGRHDVYLEIAGPAATDVHHNFVQRWNEASERHAADGVWGHTGGDDLPFPTRVSARQGGAPVQIQRNLPPGHYSDGTATPGGDAYDVARGERSVTEQYVQAIAAARRSIYIENQALPIPEISVPLQAALERGVEVMYLAPAEPEPYVRRDRKDPQHRERFERITALGRYPNFSLAGIAATNEAGQRASIYVHSKMMLVDDAWATIGSCNLHAYSLFGHSEMNATFWDPAVVRALRCELLAEHLGEDTAALDDRAALALYRRVAQDNRRLRDCGNPDWRGLAFSLDPATYAD